MPAEPGRDGSSTSIRVHVSSLLQSAVASRRTTVNIIAGATHIRARDFFVGTVIGELPGLIALSIFVDQITSTIKHPGPGSYALLAGSAALIVAGVWALRRWLSKHADRQPNRG